MLKLYRYTLVVTLALATLACGLLAPIADAKNLASTAEAMATSMPLQTLEALPSAIPDVSQYLNPTGQPVSDWNSIPIMPQASAGQEFNKNAYSFRISDTVENIQAFYNGKLPSLGWTSSFSAQGGGQGSVMLFTKDSSVLSITATQVDKDFVVLLFLE